MPLPASRNGQLAILTSNAPVRLRTSIHQSTRRHAVHLRTLWWWGLHSGERQSSMDENLEERLKRHQRIMRSRYSKAVRRRALWDREDNERWPWHMSGRYWSTRHCGVNSMSSANPNPAESKTTQKVQDPHHIANETPEKRFESFRAAVDRAIERDPYEALFGRRLQSSPFSNSSPWASLSWIYNPKKSTGDDTTGTPHSTRSSVESSAAAGHKSCSSSEPSSTPPSKGPSETVSQEEYVYDPISMRKVPVTKSVEDTRRNKPFLEAFFAEHGVDIPVKTYKPHKVHGYGNSERKSSDDSESATKGPTMDTSSNSQKQELRELLGRAKGNNIDTTASSPRFKMSSRSSCGRSNT